MPISLSDIFALPDSKRRKFRFIPKKRGKYRRETRPKRSREELAEWLREHGVRASRQIDKIRKSGDPTLSDYRMAFTRWRDAIDLAYGFQLPPANIDDPEYMAKVVTQLGIWSLRSYREARRKRPDIIPSYGAVKKKWGGFRGLKLLCHRYTMVAIFNEYMKLRRKMGRLPSADECRSANVHLDKAIEFFGNRKKLDQFVDSMERKS